MTPDKLKEIIQCGETSTVQFKQLFKTAEDIANELVAFSNSHGGNILVGIDDKTGHIVGLDYQQLQTIGSLVASAAGDRCHPTVFPGIETIPVDGKAVMVITVPEGIETPYTNNKGEIYVKLGPDKRRVSDNNEILRLFAKGGSYQPDRESIRTASITDLDIYALDEFFQSTLGRPIGKLEIILEKALKNLFILDNEGHVTLGGLMFFGKNPQRFLPAFNIKAVWFYGNSIGGTEYRDSKDIGGTIPRMFNEGMRFLESILHRRQAGQNFNSIGKLEIPEIALSEILQNALTHRSWLKPAPIRILVFDNRVEIISPGGLPPSLTVEDIKLGNAFQRNQLIANLCAKTMDYRGIGSGIIRALQTDANIEFHNEASGDQFRVILWRHNMESGEGENNPKKNEPNPKKNELNHKKNELNHKKNELNHKKNEPNPKKNEPDPKKNEFAILSLISSNPGISIDLLAEKCNMTFEGVRWQLRKLRQAGKIRRIGPDKGGYWEVIE